MIDVLLYIVIGISIGAGIAWVLLMEFSDVKYYRDFFVYDGMLWMVESVERFRFVTFKEVFKDIMDYYASDVIDKFVIGALKKRGFYITLIDLKGKEL